MPYSRLTELPERWRLGGKGLPIDWGEGGRVGISQLDERIGLLAAGSSMTIEHPKRRRHFQFTLRTLLVAILVLSLPLSWFAVRMEKAKKQREAVAAIERLHGTVAYDWSIVPPGTVASKPASTWLRTLLGNDFFDKVVEVEFWDPWVTDADLKHLEVLTDLQLLCIFSEHVTDAGLPHLENLTNLKTLSVLCDKTTDTGLEHFHGLTNLQTLCLCGKVTDAGLEHLKVLVNLKRLRLRHSNVTKEGVENLQETMPNCVIDFFREPGGRAPQPLSRQDRNYLCENARQAKWRPVPVDARAFREGARQGVPNSSQAARTRAACAIPRGPYTGNRQCNAAGDHAVRR